MCRHNDKAVQRILTTGFLQKKIFPSLIELAPGGKMTLEQAKPDVEKCCDVISGRVRCSIGQEFHELKIGNTIYFPVRRRRKQRPSTPDGKCRRQLHESPLRSSAAGALMNN